MKPEYYYLITILSEDYQFVQLRLVSAPNSQEARHRARTGYIEEHGMSGMGECVRGERLCYGDKKGHPAYRKIYASYDANKEVDSIHYFRKISDLYKTSQENFQWKRHADAEDFVEQHKGEWYEEMDEPTPLP